jgi:uncharacterized membrane protein YoaK (UPF0700 family)
VFHYILEKHYLKEKQSCETDTEVKKEKKQSVFYFYAESVVISLLAFIGGYVSATGYVKFSGLFTSVITGTLIAACSSVYVTEGVVARVMVCVGFVFGATAGFFIATICKLAEEWKTETICILLYFSEVLLLLLSFSIGMAYDIEIVDHGDSLTDWRLVLAASLMGGAMGMHNAAAKVSIQNAPSTTPMTMTIVAQSAAISQLTYLYLARPHYCCSSSSSSYSRYSLTMQREDNHEDIRILDKKISEAFEKWKIVSHPLFSFLLGAKLGASFAYLITYYAIFIPIFIILTFMVDIYFKLILERFKEIDDQEKYLHQSNSIELTKMESSSFVSNEMHHEVGLVPITTTTISHPPLG